MKHSGKCGVARSDVQVQEIVVFSKNYNTNIFSSVFFSSEITFFSCPLNLLESCPSSW